MTGRATPWVRSYPADISWGAPLPEACATGVWIEKAADKWPDRVAVEYGEAKLTYWDLRDQARKLAVGLASKGIGIGDKVVLHLPNSPAFLICFFGAMLSGATVVNVSVLAPEREVLYKCEDSEAVALFTTPSHARIAKELMRIRHVIVCAEDDVELNAVWTPIVEGESEVLDAETIRYSSAPPEYSAKIPFQYDLTNTALIQYTGGTTGEPKGAMLSHENISSFVNSTLRWDGDLSSEQQTTIAALPLSHIYGLMFLVIYNVAIGGKIVLHKQFSASRVLEDIERSKASIFRGVPTMYYAMLNHPRFSSFDLSSLQRCSLGGAPTPPSLARKIREKFGCIPLEGYALTEIACLGIRQLAETENHESSGGLPLPNVEVQICDLEDGSTFLAPEEIGEICFAGPQVMVGYWRQPELTRRTIRDGYLRTGDVGFIGRDGFVQVIGRKKEMLLVGGFNVYPSIIERTVLEHASIEACAVIGVQDPYLGDCPVAFIVPKRNCLPPSEEAVLEFLGTRLAQHEIPRYFHFIEKLPLTTVGKVSKMHLEQMWHELRLSRGDVA